METIVSNLWALLTAISILSYTINLIFLHDLALNGNLLFILLVLSTLQFTIGFVASQVTAKLAGTELLLVPIYVVYYWMVNLLSCLAAMESYVVDPQRRGTWRSPDRGV
nr:hypothetical protein [Levilactobacillus brevis]